MPKVIRYYPHRGVDLFRVQWNLTNHCNYSCSYCPEFLHNGSIPRLPKQTVFGFVNNLIDHAHNQLQKDLIISFTGGEVTQNPYFLELAEHLYQNGVYVNLLSNGSRTLNYWRRLAPYLSTVNISYHHESADINHIWKLYEIFKEHEIAVDFLVCMIPEKFDEIVELMKPLQAYTEGTVNLKPLLKNFGNEYFEYTDQQWKIMTEGLPFQMTRPVIGTYHMNLKVKRDFDDGSTDIVTCGDLQKWGENNWLGWECLIGLRQLVIDFDGEVYGGQCKVGGSYGNITKGTVKFPTKATVCTQLGCHCRSDMVIEKRRS